MIAGDQYVVGCGVSTVIPDMDFETFSAAGYYYDDAGKRRSISKTTPHGIGAVGASVYTEHPSAEILSLAYDMKDGKPVRLWVPGMAPPVELFCYFANGGIIEAWNSMFEYLAWNNICYARMGWCELPLDQLRDAMAKARLYSLPGALADAGDVLQLPNLKIADGKRLLNKFSIPQQPTKKDTRRRIYPHDDPEDANKLYAYNIGDTVSESQASIRLPDLSATELEVWLLDQKMNNYGCSVDLESVDNCIAIYEQAEIKYTAELVEITNGTANTAGEVQKIIGWMGGRGVYVTELDADAVTEALERPLLPPDVRRVLEIRQMLALSSVKKLYAIRNRVSKDGRMRDMLAYAAAHTWRWAGRGAQPQNLPKTGIDVIRCECGRYRAATIPVCPWGTGCDGTVVEWCLPAVEDALAVIATRDLATVERHFGNPVALISGCLRGLFQAAPGHDLICSDYSAIEAVITAFVAGEQWRMDVFNSHGKIYEMSASKITGVPFAEFMEHKERTGDHHPMRNKIGKYAELASGFGGWVGAWKKFGADKHLSDDEIKDAVIKWRDESPMICKLWAELENAARLAVENPGEVFGYRGIEYGVKSDILFCRLPSGRNLTYHTPRIVADERFGKPTTSLTYMGWNSSYVDGARGWIRKKTYGGKLAENAVQALARDVMAYAMPSLDAAGYRLNLMVHDELIAEVPQGFGSVEEYERIMSTMPHWAATAGAPWPIKASGGWRGRRYRKD